MNSATETLEDVGAILRRESFRVESVAKRHVFATYANVSIAVWRYETLPHDVAMFARMTHRLGMEHPRGIGLMQVVEPTCVSLEPASRAAISQLLSNGRDYIRCSTITFEEIGFRAAAVRAIVTGLAMVSRIGFPHHVFGSLRESARWQANHLVVPSDVTPLAMELQTATERARSATVATPTPRATSTTAISGVRRINLDQKFR